jgi:hypothetical protein
MIRLLSIVICLIVVACKPTQQTTSSQRGKYHEDLSAHRPKIEEPAEQPNQETKNEQRDPKEFVEAKYAVNKQLDTILDSIDYLHLTRRFLDGYSIQVYSGLNREQALEMRKELINRIPEIESTLQYAQPNFIVRAGKYFTRLEAQKDYSLLKRYFPSAIVIPEKIQIK